MIRTLTILALFSTFAVSPLLADDETDRKREEYELMKLFVETFEQIDRNYVKDVDRRELMEAAIRGMTEHLDQYSSYIPPTDVRRFNQAVDQEFAGVGISVNVRNGRLTVVSPLPGSPAYRAGVRAGDVIMEINGESTADYSIEDAVERLQGPIGRSVSMGVLHVGDEEVETLEIVREVITMATVLGDRYDSEKNWEFMLNPETGIGYIRLTHFSRRSTEELREAIDGLLKNNMKGLILDLRSNPGGLLTTAIEIADMFLESGEIVSVRGRTVDDRSWSASAGNTYPDFPLAILVNRFSASASEVVSACLQDHERAVVIGERTWGKGSVQNVIRMERGDSALKLTTASYHRPSGRNIHRFPGASEDEEWGVKPNEGFEVRMELPEMIGYQRWRTTRDVLRDGEPAEEPEPFEDRQLNKAVEWITEKIRSDGE